MSKTLTMRDNARRDQPRLFAEMVETETTRDAVTDAGTFIRPPPGRAGASHADRERSHLDAAPADGAPWKEQAIMMTAGEIAAALGGATRNGGGWLACCCCHEDKRPSLSLRDGDDGKLLVRCFAGCDPRDILAELRQRGLLPSRRDAGEPVRRANPKPAPKPASRDHGDLVPRLWRESVDPRGTLAERYLRGRGLALDDDLCGRMLRFHGRCPFGKDEADKAIYVPALIVAFRPIRNDDETRPPQAIHRIGLDQDGSKLAKLMLGPVGGCAVKLDADENVEQGLGICEGIETGLAIRATGWRPVWALGSAGAIQTFAPIPGIEALTIFADHDEIDPKTGKRPGRRRRRNVRKPGRRPAARFSSAPRAASARTGWTRHDRRTRGAFRRTRHRRTFRAVRPSRPYRRGLASPQAATARLFA